MFRDLLAIAQLCVRQLRRVICGGFPELYLDERTTEMLSAPE